MFLLSGTARPAGRQTTARRHEFPGETSARPACWTFSPPLPDRQERPMNRHRSPWPFLILLVAGLSAVAVRADEPSKEEKEAAPSPPRADLADWVKSSSWRP